MYKQGRLFPTPALTSADNVLSSAEAASAIGGHKIVTLDSGIATIASADIITNKIMAMTTGAVSNPGDIVPILLHGSYSDVSWSWVAGPIYLGLTGQITQSPIYYMLVVLGYALSPTSIYFNPEPPILGN